MSDRYSRQIRFAPIGEAGQRRLGQARVLVAGVGSLGASLAQHMVRAGVGEVRLADRDYVEPSNLQRQILFDEEDARLSLPKATAAADKLRRINSEISIKAYVTDLTAPGRLQEAAFDCDLILDGTDNAEVRLALSDECFRQGIPFLYGGAAGASGMSAALIPGLTCCLRCLIGGEEEQEGGETCDTIGMISPAVELIASLQAAEALKWLTGSSGDIRSTFVSASLWPFSLREGRLPGPASRCPHCGEAKARLSAGDLGSAGLSSESDDPDDRRHLVGEAETMARAADKAKRGRSVVLCGRDTVQLQLEPGDPELYWSRLEQLGCGLTRNPYLVRAELPAGAGRLVIFPDGRVLAQGTGEPEAAWDYVEMYLGVQAPEGAAKK